MSNINNYYNIYYNTHYSFFNILSTTLDLNDFIKIEKCLISVYENLFLAVIIN